MTERLKFLTVGEIREEIAYAVGVDPGRFEAGSQRGLRRDTLRRIAEQLRPDESDLDVQQCHLPELYESICEWLDVDYEPNAGCVWSLNKPQLKAIHRALDASDPRAVVDPEAEIATDGGVDQPGTDRSDGAELVISQGHKVVYHHDGEERVGMIREFEGDYIRLDAGISVHSSQVHGYVIYGDESEIDLIWEPEVSD